MHSKPLPVDYNDRSSIYDAIDKIMDGSYNLNEKGDLVPQPNASVIINDEALEQGVTFDDEIVKASGKESIGSVKNVVDATGNPHMLRKQRDGRWAPIGASSDTFDKDTLDAEGEKGYNSSMSAETAVTKADTSLVPLADKYLDADMNVLLMGLHGTGKTATIQALADSRGIKMKYYSCSTLDPFTDLVGVPTPVMFCDKCKADFESRVEHRSLEPKCDGHLDRQLRMVRPRDVDEAELIFFDEFNRADPKVQNAVFEMIQFGSINGEKLPHLKACWAAINPPDDEQNYAVEQIDPALMDRFDVYIEITPKPSVAYMSRFMPDAIAKALKTWWDDHQNAIRNGQKDAHSDYVSPRRLEKIGLVWCATQNTKAVYASLPPGGQFEKKKLVDMLKMAQRHVDAENGGPALDSYEDDDDLGGAGLGDRPASQFTYRQANMRIQQNDLADYLEQNPLHDATHNKVVEVLRTSIGGNELVTKYPKILNALNPSKLEAMITAFPAPKVKQMQQGFVTMIADPTYNGIKFDRLYKVLDQAPISKVPGWPTSY